MQATVTARPTGDGQRFVVEVQCQHGTSPRVCSAHERDRTMRNLLSEHSADYRCTCADNAAFTSNGELTPGQAPRIAHLDNLITTRPLPVYGRVNARALRVTATGQGWTTTTPPAEWRPPRQAHWG